MSSERLTTHKQNNAPFMRSESVYSGLNRPIDTINVKFIRFDVCRETKTWLLSLIANKGTIVYYVESKSNHVHDHALSLFLLQVLAVCYYWALALRQT